MKCHYQNPFLYILAEQNKNVALRNTEKHGANQVIVKTKLGILKSKIKKADFVYHDLLPDGRLDPGNDTSKTPTENHDVISASSQKTEENKKPASVKFLSLPKMKRNKPHDIMVTMSLDKGTYL